MANRGPLIAGALALVPLLVAGFLLLITTSGAEEADFELLPINPGGPVGVGRLEQEEDRLRGRLVVWGLGPGSRHLVVLRGPGGACRPESEQAAPQALVLPELVADPNGVAFARVDAQAGGDVVEEGYYVLVYSGPGSPRANARVACGDLLGGGRLEPSAVASVGPGAAARSPVSTIVQLRDGRPIGGAQRIEARAGDRVALAIRSELPDEVEIPGLGLTQQVGPGTIARFSLLAPRPGRYPLRARTGGPDPVATLLVRERSGRRPR